MVWSGVAFSSFIHHNYIVLQYVASYVAICIVHRVVDYLYSQLLQESADLQVLHLYFVLLNGYRISSI